MGKRTKKFCAMSAGKASKPEYDLIVRATCQELGWPLPLGVGSDEALVLHAEFSPGRVSPEEAESHPSYWLNKQGGRRRWKHDYLWPGECVAVEIEGISPHGSRNRHTSFVGYSEDCEKYRVIALLGLTLLRYTPIQLRAGHLLEDLRFLVASRKGVVESSP